MLYICTLVPHCFPIVHSYPYVFISLTPKKMLLSFVPLVLTPVLFLTVLCTRFDWSVENGKTRLRGNSFGSGYADTTYDYIVS